MINWFQAGDRIRRKRNRTGGKSKCGDMFEIGDKVDRLVSSRSFEVENGLKGRL